MLEIKNLSKTYYPKNGAAVQALKNVSVSFSETGLVFVLGKSGCGKSTFLNLVGGLDSVSGGEFIIKGRSSKDFKSADFDSYRNTFIGFVFQEYNILNEFSVSKNVALAFELQGKKAEEQIIKDTLSKVDLDGYESRKPSELSGGQKQRVAIARALVKGPQIILADEPTGSLDSATGKQIFELLKRLSKDKLVIVVSHDREYAASYADRVIEFLDGEIISDKAKQADSLNDTASHTVINISTKNETSNQITTTNIQNQKARSNTFKKSHLPLKHAAKMGVNSLISKPIRLIFTILLSFIAFGLFGVSDALAAYNKYDATYNSMKNSGILDTSFTKLHHVQDGNRKYTYEVPFTTYDLLKLSNDFPSYDFNALYEIDMSYGGFFERPIAPYYSCNNYSFSGVIEVDDNHFENRFQLIGSKSRYPLATDEIMIPYFIYEAYRDFGLTEFVDVEGEEYQIGVKKEINTPDSLIGETINGVGGKELKVVGILDTKFPSERFEILKKQFDEHSLSLEQESAYTQLSASRNSYHSAMYTAKGFIKEHFADSYYLFGENRPVLNTETPYDFFQAYPVDYFSESELYYLDGNNSLEENQILVDPYLFAESLSENYFEIYHGTMVYNRLRAEILSLYDEDMQEKFINTLYNYPSIANLLNYTDFSTPPTFDDFYEFVYNQRNGYLVNLSLNFDRIKDQYVIEYLLERATQKSTLSYKLQIPSELGTRSINVEVTGLYLRYYDGNDTRNGAIVANTEFLDANFIFDSIPIKSIITRLTLNKDEDMRLIKNSYKQQQIESDGVTYTYSYRMKNVVNEKIDSVNSQLEQMARIVLFVGIGIAVFASLLFMNFIAASINHKKKEIGILRAIGARSMDVFKIFFIESLIIAVVSFILASVAAGAACYFINYFLWKKMEFIITLFTFSARQVVIIFAISIIVAILSSFVPVYRAARKKPVEAIRTA